jgi:hypothetical protein
MTATSCARFASFARGLGLFIVLWHAASGSASAQGPRVSFPEPVSQAFRQSAPVGSLGAAAGIIGSSTKDYRYTGMYVGLGTFAALNILGFAICSGQEGGCHYESGVLGFVGGALLSGGVGALVGSLFPKHQGGPAPASP